jgi:adenosylhomocysteine nucleosidase
MSVRTGVSKTLSGAGPIGILAALPQEIEGLIEQIGTDIEGGIRTETHGQRDFHIGRLHGRDCVVVLSRIGKVAAAATAATLIHRFGVCGMVFTGVAGGVSRDVHVGDIVVAETLTQHDMDASPLFPRFEVPLLDRTAFHADPMWTDTLMSAAASFLKQAREGGGDDTLLAARVHRGLIASGDQFVSDTAALKRLQNDLPGLLAVDMESAAVAQVCYEHGVPLAVVRSISDGADEHAAHSFAHFLENVAGRYAGAVLQRFLDALPPDAV